MKNCTLYPADILPLTAPAGGVVAGNAYLIGRFFGVAVATVAATLEFQLATKGVFDLPHTATETFAEGAVVYWNDTSKKVTSTAGGNTLIGAAAAAAAGTDATASVKIPLGAQA